MKKQDSKGKIENESREEVKGKIENKRKWKSEKEAMCYRLGPKAVVGH